ncbi:MAG TPA: hypothetical protein VIW29_16285 [Polyangiaceae bacterium]
MAPRPGSRKAARRKTTPLLLRALAALAALLLAASSLGQVAHFLLVPHAICAEHGELLELHDGEHRAAEAGAEALTPDDATSPRAAAPDAVESHDHCQLLARSQRELALPVATAFEAPLAPSVCAPSLLHAAAEPTGQLAALSLAPKTSPPVAALG